MATVVAGYVPKPEGDAALRAGVEEARRRGARLVVVHAVGDDDGEPSFLGDVRGVLADAGVEHDLRVLERGYDASDQLVAVAEELAADHLPGAVYVDMDTALAAPPGTAGRHPLPETTVFEAAMRAAGVSGDRPVVVYDDWGGQAAARCWWLLRHNGHADVRVLDGGWAAWTAAGLPVESGPGTAAAAETFTAAPAAMPVVAAADVPSVGVLIDARAAARYRGETEPIDPVAGRIPGAVNVPTALNLGAGGCFRTAAELRDVYAAMGATGS